MADVPTIAMDFDLIRALRAAEKAVRDYRPDPAKRRIEDWHDRACLVLDKLDAEEALAQLCREVGEVEDFAGDEVFDANPYGGLVRRSGRVREAMWAPEPLEVQP
jgi:hypothetical protein